LAPDILETSQGL